MVKWSQHFSARDGNYVQLIAEPDYEYLSERECEALDKGAELIRGLIAKHGRIADVLHDLWPEWKNPQGSGKGSIPLTPEEVLGQVIEDDDEAERVAREIESVQTAKAALARPHDPMDSKIVREIIKRAKTHVAFQPILRKLLPA